MIDLFKYSSTHNVSIEVSTLSLTPLIYDIKMRRDNFQVNTSISTEIIDDSDRLLEYVLDSLVIRLNRYINSFKVGD